MKGSLSTLLTTLLFSAAIVPNALAQGQKPGFLVGFFSRSANVPEQSAPNATQPTAAKTEVVPATPTSPVPNRNAINSERSRPSVDRSSIDGAYPTYCPALPSGAKPDDWEYRAALEKCLYGS